MTRATLLVLQALLVDPAAKHYGYPLLKVTGLKSGSLYPILDRLERDGWIEGQWDAEPAAPGRPPRRWYQLTGLGLRSARATLSDPHRQRALGLGPAGTS